jgi:HD-like signal output (HDOD) protein
MAEASDDSVTTWPKAPDAWVNILARGSPPVLKRSLDDLSRFQDAIYDIPVRTVADVVESDPMLTLNLMMVVGRFQSSRPTQIESVEEALLMLGCVNFVRKAMTFQTVDAMLAKRPEALLGTLRAAARARRAGMFLRQWARMRNDRNEGACVVAALLYEIADLLAWIYAPEKMIQFESVVRENPRRKITLTRWMEFGFEWDELENKLLRRFKLSDLVTTLIKPTPAEQTPSSELVARGVDFSRKLADSRNINMLQDELRDIARMLKVPTAKLVREMRLENTPLAAAASVPEPPVEPPADPPAGTNAAA